jgi:hypothetical protein
MSIVQTFRSSGSGDFVSDQKRRPLGEAGFSLHHFAAEGGLEEPFNFDRPIVVTASSAL